METLDSIGRHLDYNFDQSRQKVDEQLLNQNLSSLDDMKAFQQAIKALSVATWAVKTRSTSQYEVIKSIIKPR